MALTGVNFSETVRIVSKHDPDKENPTIFEIGVLDSEILAHIEDSSQKFIYTGDGKPAEMNINSNKRNHAAFRFGVKNIINYLDPITKKPIKFDTVSVPIGNTNYMAISTRIMKIIHPSIINEIGAKILDGNQLTEPEQKN